MTGTKDSFFFVKTYLKHEKELKDLSPAIKISPNWIKKIGKKEEKKELNFYDVP